MLPEAGSSTRELTPRAITARLLIGVVLAVGNVGVALLAPMGSAMAIALGALVGVGLKRLAPKWSEQVRRVSGRREHRRGAVDGYRDRRADGAGRLARPAVKKRSRAPQALETKQHVILVRELETARSPP